MKPQALIRAGGLVLLLGWLTQASLLAQEAAPSKSRSSIQKPSEAEAGRGGSSGQASLAKQRHLKRTMENGRAAFFQYACWRCHALGDTELPGDPDFLNQGPDLLTVGDRLTKEDIRQSIIDPNAAIPEPVKDHTTETGVSRMPSFAEALPAAELNDLVIFLSESRSARSPTVNVTEKTFDREVKQASSLVLLDFWAEWCLPCLELEPILDKLAVEFQNEIKICKINIDENPALVAEYVPDNIFPCLILMKDARLIERRYGTDPKMKPEAFLRQWISQHLAR